MSKNDVVIGLDISKGGKESPICEGCILGEHARTAIPRKSLNRSPTILDLVHSDVAGPLPVQSKGGARYFVTFIDDKSRWVSVYPIKANSDCFETFMRYKRFVEKQTGRKIIFEGVRPIGLYFGAPIWFKYQIGGTAGGESRRRCCQHFYG